MALSAGTVVGPYRVEALLGRGGMATVYSARHLEHGRLVALKVLAGELSDDPDFVARFRREGRLQATLEHPHAVTVYEAGESEQGLYLALRLIPGPTLATLMQERELGAARSVALLRQVAGALDAAHAAGLVHRDVKPQNVLVGDADDAYLGDFGLTRLGGASGVTATGRLVGTISYLSPEVTRGMEAGPAADRYAFAAMAFECFTGTVVFPRRTEAAILLAHSTEPPPRASRRRPELPKALDALFEQALSKQPQQRPDSATRLVDEIAQTLEGTGSAGLGPPPPPGVAALDDHNTVEAVPVAAGSGPHTSRGRHLTGLLVAAALIGAALAVGATVLLDNDSDASPPAPASLRGAEILGTDLSQPGRALDCRGEAPRPASPGCTIIQTELPGHALVVPEDGVVRRWGVRSARGELALSVVRPRGDDTFQVARSRNEFVSNAGVHLFATNLAVERGDLVGLVLLPGSATGARAGVDGATTTRWIPNLATGEPDETGFARELLLRVEYVRGGQQRLPDQVTGAEAETLEPGRTVRRRRLRFTNGRPVEVKLVSLGDAYALDEFVEGARTARIDVPDFRPKDGRIVTFDVYSEDGVPELLGVTVEWARTESARLLDHFYSVAPREFFFVD